MIHTLSRIALVSLAVLALSIVGLPAGISPAGSVSASLCIVEPTDPGPGVTCTVRQVQDCVTDLVCRL